MPRLPFKIGDLLGIFRAPSIATLVELTEFSASQSAFIAQKCTIEYCQARSGPMWHKLEKEPAFLVGLERARWEAYPMVLSDMLVMVEGMLRLHLRMVPPVAQVTCFERCFADALERYRPPSHRGEGATWEAEKKAFGARLGRARLAPPRPVHEIGEETGHEMHRLMPIHPDHKRHDRAMIAASVKMRLARAHEDLAKRLDLAALTADLARHFAPR